MSTTSIGLMLPTSTIFPIAREYEKGFKSVIDKLDTDVEIIKEFVGQGGVKQVEDACDKFFGYYDADIITGICSSKSVEEISEKFNLKKKPFIVSNLGGHVPNLSKLNSFIALNSLQLWRHAWTLGHYGVSHFGKKGMFIAGVYDAGYGFSQMFHKGMMDADPTSEWSFSVPPMPVAGELSNMDVIFPYLEQYQPDFVFAAFCGTEATLFLNEFLKRGWQHRTKLLGLPYLISPFAPLVADVKIYTTRLQGNEEILSPDKAFFYLGKKAAELVAEMISQGNIKDFSNTGEKFTDTIVLKEQGVLVDTVVDKMYSQLIIEEHMVIAGDTSYTSKEISTHQAFSFTEEALQEVNASFGASWFNPYLCI